MNSQLSIYLYNKIISANFLWADIVAASVRTQTEDKPTNEDTAAVNTVRYPVSSIHNQTDCQGQELPCIPDGNRKSLLYFEENGTNKIEWLGRSGFSSSIRLVFWCNKARLVADGYNERLIAEIESQLIELLAPRKHANGPGFLRLLGEVNRIPASDSSIFSKYSYKEQDKQYLRPPYDFFAIDFTFRYNAGPGCVQPVNYESAVCL